MKEINQLPDAELKIKAIETLNNALGVAGALKFLILLHREPTNPIKCN